MIKIREAIVVEGRYDKNTLSQIVDAPIFQTDGFAVMNDKVQLSLLWRVAQTRGLIVFTDSDGAGFVIRNYLKGAISPVYLKHAYIPDILGKEKRKAKPGKEGKLGVEGMSPDIIIHSLIRAGATIDGEDGINVVALDPITKQDLFMLGLSGGQDSKNRRTALLKALQLPEHMSANAMLQTLNVLFTREAFFSFVENDLYTENLNG